MGHKGGRRTEPKKHTRELFNLDLCFCGGYTALGIRPGCTGVVASGLANG